MLIIEETGEQNPGTPGEEGTPSQRLGSITSGSQGTWGLRALQVLLANAFAILQIDNAYLAADDLRVKYEMELAMRHSVKRNIHGFQQVTDDTNITGCSLR